MFVLNKDRIVSWPVKVQVPMDGGRHETQEFTARFKLVAQERLDTLTSVAPADAHLLREVLVGWDGIAREGGQSIGFDEEAREELIGIPYVRLGLIAAYLEALTGAKRKN